MDGNAKGYLTGSRDITSPAAALCILLYLCRGWKSTEPEDQVYALLGLVPRIMTEPVSQDAFKEILQPGKKYWDVFTLLARWIIEQTRWLGYLTLLEDSESRVERKPWIPYPKKFKDSESRMERKTWVADLRELAPSRVGIMEGFAHAPPLLKRKADKSKLPCFDGNILCCTGTQLGIISHVSEAMQDLLEGSSTFEAGARLILDSRSQYPFTKERREDVMWRTLTGGNLTDDSLGISFGQFWLRRLVEIGLRSNKDDFCKSLQAIDGLGRSVSNGSFPTADKVRQILSSADTDVLAKGLPDAIVRDSGAFEAAFRRICPFRKLFLTDKNHIGICHSALRKGDELWYLARAPTPFVLRRMDSTPRFTLIGHTYVHGFFHSIWETLEIKDNAIQIV
jgi:hypothetical protein